MKVSCVIPTRDRRQMVCAAIESVLAQETPVAEIIVVDDGSVDNTGEYLQKEYADIKVVALNGLGPGPARNAGVAASRGEVIMFLDADDIWLPGHVADLLGVLAGGFEVAYGICRNLDRLKGGEFSIPAAEESCQGDCFHALLRWCFLLPSAVAVSRRAFARVGGFSADCGRIGEDWLFFLRLAAEFDFGFVNRQISIRNLHSGSLCNGISPAAICLSLGLIRANLTAVVSGDNDYINERFQTLERWTTDNGEHWTSVQDWYLSMKEGGMI